MVNKPKDVWQIRSVDPEVRGRITTYARMHNMSVAQALSFLTTPGSSKVNPDYGIVQTGSFAVSGDLRAAYEELRKRYE